MQAGELAWEHKQREKPRVEQWNGGVNNIKSKRGQQLAESSEEVHSARPLGSHW